MGLEKFVKEALHVKRGEEHYLQFTYEPKQVRWFSILEPYKRLYKFKHSDGTESLTVIIVGPQVNKNEVFMTKKGYVKFRDKKGLDLDCAKKFITNTKYLATYKKFAAPEQRLHFECIQRFLAEDQMLPVVIDSMGDAREKLSVIKTLEKILIKVPRLKDYARNCGVCCEGLK